VTAQTPTADDVMTDALALYRLDVEQTLSTVQRKTPTALMVDRLKATLDVVDVLLLQLQDGQS
jgi:hypothetical protein